MNKNDLFSKLVSRAKEMALDNKWGEKSLKINMMILEMDSANTSACTRLAKYYKVHNNLAEAKRMYSKALDIDPNNQGAMNNLRKIEKHQADKEFVKTLTTGKDANAAARTWTQKGRYDLAVKCLIKAYSIEPLLKYAVNLAKIYKKLGKHDEVKNVYTQLVNNEPSKNNIETINAEFAVLMKI